MLDSKGVRAALDIMVAMRDVLVGSPCPASTLVALVVLVAPVLPLDADGRGGIVATVARFDIALTVLKLFLALFPDAPPLSSPQAGTWTV